MTSTPIAIAVILLVFSTLVAGIIYATAEFDEIIAQAREDELSTIGAGELLEDARGVRDSGGLTATLTAASAAGAGDFSLDQLIDEVTA